MPTSFKGIEAELLTADSLIKQDEILGLIRVRVSELLDKDPELLMSYLYRLDILEWKLKALLSENGPLEIGEGISQLIYERQKERVATKKKYKQGPIKGWEF